MNRFFALATLLAAATGAAHSVKITNDPPVRVLMLGDQGHHRPAELAKLLTKSLAADSIALDYTENTGDLNPAVLSKYRSLLFYLNTDVLPPENERALLQFVESGGGLTVLHCASACFGNSEVYTKLVGGRFLSHQTGTFRARILDAQHPAMRGFAGFSSFDETYVHSSVAPDIQILMAREAGSRIEPWTWTRTQGRGLVFYTASGHDEHTWNEKGFQELVSRGVRFVNGTLRFTDPELKYHKVEIPPSVRDGGETLTIPDPLSPSDSMQRMHVPEGFRVELFASEPDVVKPISMAFDERGRLWVVESLDYPNRLDDPGARGRDRIKICEDTNGDGRADKFTIFADGLNLPQSIAFAGGGVVVARSPEILFMQDRDGDGKCDETRVLYRGFGRGDTHAMLGNFHASRDGWIYATCGYSGLSVESAGKHHNSGQCLFRFRADRDAFEILTPTSNNTWGFGMNAEGEIFASTANNSHAIELAIPNRYFEAVSGWGATGSAEIEDHKYAHPVTKDVRQVDFNGGYTAASGFTICKSDAFPQKYQHRAAFVCEPTMHLIHADLLERSGSGHVAHDGFNIFASSDPWTAPIQTVEGPDGALWFIDWYNYIIQHNPTPQHYKNGRGNAYETPLRDDSHGRIYRIVYSGSKAAPAAGEAPNITKEREARERRVALRRSPRTKELLDSILNNKYLHDPDAAMQLAALLALAEMPEGVWPGAGSARAAEIGRDLAHLTKDASVMKDRWLPLAITAAAARAGVDYLQFAMEGQKIQKEAGPRMSILQNGDMDILQNGAPAGWEKVLYSGEARLTLDEGNFGGSGADAAARESRSLKIESRRGADAGWLAHFTVRKNTTYRLSGWIRTQDVDAGSGNGALFNIHELQNPRVMTRGLAGTSDWTYVETTFDSGGHEQLGVNALFGGWGQSRGTAYYDHLRIEEIGSVSDDLRVAEVVVRHLARSASGEFAKQLPRLLAAADAGVAARILQLTAADWPDANAAPGGGGEYITQLLQFMKSAPAGARAPLIRLLEKWKITDPAVAAARAVVAGELLQSFADPSRDDGARLIALEQWFAIAGDGADLEPVFLQIRAASPAEFTSGIFNIIGKGRAPEIAGKVISQFPAWLPAVRRQAIELLFKRPAWTLAMLDAMERNDVSAADFSPAQVSALSRHSDVNIKNRAAALLSKKGGFPSEDRDKIVKSLIDVAQTPGDAEIGRAVFTKNCAVCHLLRGEGAKVGPDLTGVMNGNKEEILTNILDPNRSVESNFRQWVVWKKDGQIAHGLLTSETRTSFELVDSTGKRQTVLRADVDDMRMEPMSLMPVGFESLTRAELAGLLEFIVQHK